MTWKNSRWPLRLPFLLPAGVALLLGLDAALLRLGLGAPLDAAALAAQHAPLMVFGFLGALIALERAVAVRRGWAYASPALLAFGALELLLPVPAAIGRGMIVLGLLVLLAIYLTIWRRAAATAIAIQALGAVAGLVATLPWLGGAPVPSILPGIAAFIVLTIAGERLELARISPAVTPRAERLGAGAAALLLLAATAAALWSAVGTRLLGLMLGLLVLWLLRIDVASRLVAARGLPRYMAACLLAGYAWLLVTAGIWLIAGEAPAGTDAAIHATFLGFAMSMVMAHAPVILPAVLRRPLPYRPMLVVPVVLLHASLLVRLLGGDAWAIPGAWQWGGVLNVAAVLLFAVLAAISAVLGPPASRPAPASTASAA